jgi:glycosyltransferase involved in cell wall biosynthesis
MKPLNDLLGVAITTKNNMRTIRECVGSVLALTDHVLIIDSGSTDGTAELCSGMGCQVIHREWSGPVKQKQFGLDQFRNHPWVLTLDSDESLDEELQHDLIQKLRETPEGVDGYSFNRKIWFLNGWLNHVFQPEYRVRISRGGRGEVLGIGEEGKGGHDHIEVPGTVLSLAGVCKHDSWTDIDDMIRRFIVLGRRSAEYDPKPTRSWRIVFNPLAAFLKQYLLKQGFRDGLRGMIACGAIACGTMIKHIQKNSQRAL